MWEARRGGPMMSFAPKLDLWEASPTPMWVNFGIG
jgi:hypothetical protein